MLVEKILEPGERLDPAWPVHGTTGYRFAGLLSGLFVDGAAASRFDRIYRSFTGDRRSFEEHAYDGRMLIMGTTLFAELSMLAARLARIAAGNRWTRDYTASGLRKALAEVAARFPVYRTYVSARGVSAADRRTIEEAVLTLDAAPPRGARRKAMLGFAMRYQQFTSPVVAKGVEDTAFYRYGRLAALNEVGNDPREFGVPLKAFHAAAAERARRWPWTMLGTSTHDTKRSEDVRARLAVLSELAPAWRLALRRWGKQNRRHRTELGGEPAPSRLDEYLFYQALLGIWGTDDLAGRLKAYMLKAAREAKLRTSWINPDLEYERALERFVGGSLADRAFLGDVEEMMARLGRLGLLVGLSQALIKVASPGVPDYYQGTELWDFSLVDPDNRRPVDYALRKKLLSREAKRPGDLLRNLPDGQAKLHVIRKGLELRKRQPALFHGGEYLPLYADEARVENVCAFALRGGGKTVIAVAPRLFARLMEASDPAPLGARAWGDARLAVPPGSYRDVLTGAQHEARRDGVRVADLLGDFPLALLESD